VPVKTGVVPIDGTTAPNGWRGSIGGVDKAYTVYVLCAK
jgi:hypothetical protein